MAFCHIEMFYISDSHTNRDHCVCFPLACGYQMNERLEKKFQNYWFICCHFSRHFRLLSWDKMNWLTLKKNQQNLDHEFVFTIENTVIANHIDSIDCIVNAYNFNI